MRIRQSDLQALARAADHTEVSAAAGGGPDAVEMLLRAAVDRLDDSSLGAAAMATFGLARGARDKSAQERRRRAALVYRVSVERFRKHQEVIVLNQVAEEILKLCPPSRSKRSRDDYPAPEVGPRLIVAGAVGDRTITVTIRMAPVEVLSGVDVVVVPQNIYLELPQHFKSSMAAAVSRTAARRGDDGQIVADVVHDELLAWVREHGRTGLPVAAGSVVATSAGEMARQGVRRLYHAAIASPRPGTNDYDVEPPVIAHAVRQVLATARVDRTLADLPIRSLGFPLLGAGRGGLTQATSFAWLWLALERELATDAGWDIHFIARRRVTADLIVSKLAEVGVIPVPGRAEPPDQ